MSELQTALGLFRLRELEGMAELAEAERLQLEVWGPDTVPESRELLLAVQHAGGLAGGAFDPQGRLAGMVFGFPTRDPLAQHSHRLAVLDRWRGLGLGASLKWFQRGWCRERGIRRVTWTVDPLRMPNAELNAGRLGACARRYFVDYYGAMQGIDAGLPSDRLLMEWELEDERVERLAQNAPADRGYPEALPANRVEGERPLEAGSALEARQILLCIPPDFLGLAAAQPALALEWRLHTRRLFQACFERGYAVRGFTRQGGPAYVLEKEF